MSTDNKINLKPVITEKATIGTDIFNRYEFKVLRDINKFQIKEAVEKTYNVKVEKVWTKIGSSKKKRTSKGYKMVSGDKQAVVQIAKGQKIEFFKGV